MTSVTDQCGGGTGGVPAGNSGGGAAGAAAVVDAGSRRSSSIVRPLTSPRPNFSIFRVSLAASFSTLALSFRFRREASSRSTFSLHCDSSCFNESNNALSVSDLGT